MAQYRKKPDMIEAITFDELVQHGIASGGNIVDGMPWAFHYSGLPVTHESNDCYHITTREGGLRRMTREDMLITDAKGDVYPFRKDIFDGMYEPSAT